MTLAGIGSGPSLQNASLNGGMNMAEKKQGTAKRFCCCIAALMLVFPAVCAAYQQRLIHSTEEGDCSLRVEADDQARMLRLRVHPEYPRCHATKESVQRTLKDVFSTADPPKLQGVYTSLYLGRLIDFPWLCEYLALTAYNDSRWDKKRGKPVSMDLHRYVSAVLSNREVLSQFEEAFGDSGYAVTAVSVEKVLVGRLGDVPLYQGSVKPGKVPFDAMVWFRLEKK